MIFTLLNQPWLLIPAFAAIILAFTIHEFSHALVADRLGDPTARNAGRLTLNPMAHMHPLGFLLLITVGIGFGRPVPYDDRNLRNKTWGAALIGMAGPISNLLVALVAIIILVFATGIPSNSLLVVFLQFLAAFNVALMVFNLFPIPPLDGSKVLFALLPSRLDYVKDFLEQYGPYLLILLILLPGSFIGSLFQTVLTAITSVVVTLANLT